MSASTIATTVTTPSAARVRRSLRDACGAADLHAVHVDVAGRNLAGDGRTPVDQIDDDAVLGDDDPVGLATPVRMARSALARRWRHSPCTGMTLRGLTML